MIQVIGLEPGELTAHIGGPTYRSMQLFEWIYQRGVEDFSQMTNLPLELREQLAENFVISLPEIVTAEHAKDGTTKYALKAGGEIIETVHMPEEARDTLCISSQAGC